MPPHTPARIKLRPLRRGPGAVRMPRIQSHKEQFVNAHTDHNAPVPAENVYHCAGCGLELPISICPECEDAVSVGCAGCGARYRGIIDTDNTHLRLNIKIREG